MKTSEYIPNLLRGTRVILAGQDPHPNKGALRFLERCLDRIDAAAKGSAA